MKLVDEPSHDERRQQFMARQVQLELLNALQCLSAAEIESLANELSCVERSSHKTRDAILTADGR